MQSCPGSGSQSQEQRAGRRRQQIIAKCIASTVGPSRRKGLVAETGTRNPQRAPARQHPSTARQGSEPLGTGPSAPRKRYSRCVLGARRLLGHPWRLAVSPIVEGLQKEKFRGGNVTEVGNHRLVLGGKPADDLENFCAVWNWVCLLTLSISCAQVGGK